MGWPLVEKRDKCYTKLHFQLGVKESSVLSGPNYLELSSLESNRRYDIWVKAETKAGYGPSSDVVSVILGNTGTSRKLLGINRNFLKHFFIH